MAAASSCLFLPQSAFGGLPEPISVPAGPQVQYALTIGSQPTPLPDILLTTTGGRGTAIGLTSQDLYLGRHLPVTWTAEEGRVSGNQTLRQLAYATKFREFSSVLDVAVVEGRLAGTVRHQLSRAIGDGVGSTPLPDFAAEVTGLVITEAELAAVNRFTGAGSWDSYVGTNQNSSATDQGLAINLWKPRLRWVSPYLGGMQIGDTRHGLRLFNEVVAGAATPLIADGRVYQYHQTPVGDTLQPGYQANYLEGATAALRADAYAAASGRTVTDVLRGYAVHADEFMSCFDAATGRLLWQVRWAGEGMNLPGHKDALNNHTGCIGGGKVFVFGSMGVVRALDLATGRQLWETAIPDYAATMQSIKQDWLNGKQTFKERSYSHALNYSGGVVVAPMALGSGPVCGLDAETGAVRWQNRGVLGESSTPLRWTARGEAFFLIAGEEGVTCLRASDGTIAWSLPEAGVSPLPVALEGNYLLAPRGCWALTPTAPIKLWDIPEGAEFNARSVGTIYRGNAWIRGGIRGTDIGGLVVRRVTDGVELWRDPTRRTDKKTMQFAAEGWFFYNYESAHNDAHNFEPLLAEPPAMPTLGTGWRPPYVVDLAYMVPVMYPVVEGRIFMRSIDALYCFDLRTAGPAPEFVTQPRSQTAATGQDVSLVAAATGSPTPAYKWRKQGNAIAGATAPTLTLRNVAAKDAGSYDCLALNAQGSTQSTTANLVVTPPVAPTITVHPQSATIQLGNSLTLEVQATGAPAPSWQWRKNGVNLPAETQPVLTIFEATLNDGGSYDCVATNSVGSATSRAATVAVEGHMAPLFTRQPENQAVAIGQLVTFVTAAEGRPPPTLQWRRNGVAMAGATSPTLAIFAGPNDDGAVFYCVASNSEGTDTTTPALLRAAPGAEHVDYEEYFDYGPLVLDSGYAWSDGTGILAYVGNVNGTFAHPAYRLPKNPLGALRIGDYAVAPRGVQRTIANQAFAGTFWISFLLQKASAAAQSPVFLALNDSSTYKNASPAGAGFGVSGNGTALVPVFRTSAGELHFGPEKGLALGRFHLLLAKVSIGEGPDSVRLWVKQESDALAPTEDALGDPDLSVLQAEFGAGLRSLWVGQQASGGVNYLDAIRLSGRPGDAGLARVLGVGSVIGSNTPPTLTPPNAVRLRANSASQPIPFTVADTETSPNQLSVSLLSSNPTLLPSAGIALGGTGANRTLTLRPSANLAGVALLTLSVSDGELRTQASFLLTVDDTFESWSLQQSLPPGQNAPFADPDADGLVNFAEFALGGSALAFDRAPVSVTMTAFTGNVSQLEIAIPRNPLAAGVTYLVEVSSDLTTWHHGAPATTIVEDTPERLIVRDNFPFNRSEPRFMRLRLSFEEQP